VSFSPEIRAALSGPISSCLSGFIGGCLSELAGVPRSNDPPDARGGGISLESRPFSTPRVLFEVLSRFSRADSPVHLGGGSGRTRSRSLLLFRSGRLKSLEFASIPRRSLPEKSRGLSPGRSPGLSPNLPPGRSNPLPSGNRESLKSLRSPWRDGCLSSKSLLGNGASGLVGRLGAGRSAKEGLENSGRGGMVESLGGGEAFAALFRLKFSLSLRTSDFLVSLTLVAGVVDLGSEEATIVVGLIVEVPVEVFASSTSPSSTSVVVNGLGVGAPRELEYR
jgi:hypothetical protein